MTTAWQESSTVDKARLQRRRATKQYWDVRSGKENVNGSLQAQLEKDDGGSRSQSQREESGL